MDTICPSIFRHRTYNFLLRGVHLFSHGSLSTRAFLWGHDLYSRMTRPGPSFIKSPGPARPTSGPSPGDKQLTNTTFGGKEHRGNATKKNQQFLAINGSW